MRGSHWEAFRSGVGGEAGSSPSTLKKMEKLATHLPYIKVSFKTSNILPLPLSQGDDHL